MVQIGPADPTDAAPFPKPPLVGVISPVGQTRSGGLRRFFLKNPNRFPAVGGYDVLADQPCRIVVTAEAQGTAGTQSSSAPLEFVPGPGAIINLRLEV